MPRKAAPAASPAADPSSARSGGKVKPAAAKRAPEVKYDELENIAAIIAGAGLGGGSEAEVVDLADAVKKSNTPRKKK